MPAPSQSLSLFLSPSPTGVGAMVPRASAEEPGPSHPQIGIQNYSTTSSCQARASQVRSDYGTLFVVLVVIGAICVIIIVLGLLYNCWQRRLPKLKHVVSVGAGGAEVVAGGSAGGDGSAPQAVICRLCHLRWAGSNGLGWGTAGEATCPEPASQWTFCAGHQPHPQEPSMAPAPPGAGWPCRPELIWTSP